MNLTVLALIEREYLFIIAVAAIFLVFVGIYVIKIALRNHRYRRQLRELEKKYETMNALLIGQDSQYVRRLEIISQSNLLYGDVHHNFLTRYETLKNKQNHHAKMALGVLKDLVEKKKFHGLKDTFKKNREVVLIFEEHVQLFNEELRSVLNIEEKCRVNALSQKEKLRRLKSIYFEHEAELSLVSESFDTVFANIDEAFGKFEECIDRATYDEVEAILKRIADVLMELDKVIDEMPVLCALVEEVMPSKIRRLKEEFNKMSNSNYPVHHLRVVNGIEEMNQELLNVRKKMLSLSVDGCRERLSRTSDSIEELLNAFEEEKNAKVVFEKRSDSVYSSVNLLEKDFIKLCNLIPDIKRLYIISDVYANKVEEIRGDISKLSLIRRTLDNFIHSNTKQPYSLLLEKLEALDMDSVKIIENMRLLREYLLSLEKDIAHAGDYINKTYFNLKNLEKNVRDVNIESYISSVETKFNQCYEFVDRIDSGLKQTPINVSEINTLLNGLSIIHEELVKKVENDINFAIAGENLVVFANRDRHRLSDVKTLLTQIEISFMNGEFERVYLETGNIVKKIQVKV